MWLKVRIAMLALSMMERMYHIFTADWSNPNEITFEPCNVTVEKNQMNNVIRVD